MKGAIYKKYLIAILMVIYAFNFVDRFALALVLDDIKADLHLTDSELGALGGIAFALFYSIMGVPIARWADRGNRARIIALTAAVWSVAVAICGMATSFLQLLLIRIGVGIGEAGCVPPAHSIIADYYSRTERPRANALYQQGINMGGIVAYLVAGWLNQFYGWRMMFLILSVPGFILAVIAWLTIREPRFDKSRMVVTSHVANAPSSREHLACSTDVSRSTFKTVIVALGANATFRHVLYGFSLWYFFGYGISQWQPAFFVRSFGQNTGDLGTLFAIVFGVCGLLGTYWGGLWATRFAPNNERLQLRVISILNVAFNGALWSLIYCSHDFHMALALTGLGSMGGALIFGPLFATIQTLVPESMRATAVAIVLLFANLVGMGLGPLAVGVLSDALHPFFGQESLRYALLALCPGYLWVSWHFWHASKTVTQDIEALQYCMPREVRNVAERDQAPLTEVE